MKFFQDEFISKYFYQNTNFIASATNLLGCLLHSPAFQAKESNLYHAHLNPFLLVKLQNKSFFFFNNT